MSDDQFSARRTAVLAAAKSIAERAKAEGRGLTPSEQSEVDGALDEVKRIDARSSADGESKRFLSQLDAMAAGRYQQHDDSRRLAFTKSMATGLADKMLAADGIGGKALGPSGAAVVGQEFSPSPVELGKPANSLLAVLNVKTHATPEFSYLRATTRTNLAAVVAEGGTKPTSTYSVVRIEDSLKIVAHLSEGIPRFWLLDNDALVTFIDAELRYGLQVAIENKVLADVNAVSGLVLQPYATNTLTVLRKSLTTLETAGYEAGFFLVNPADWEAVELSLASTNAIEHMALPYDSTRRALFGVPVVVSPAEAAGVSHTVGQGAVALDTDSRGVAVQWSETSNATDFATNTIRARCETRVATSIYRPDSIVKCDLTP
jgi:HK97 family phage major capsid protein